MADDKKPKIPPPLPGAKPYANIPTPASIRPRAPLGAQPSVPAAPGRPLTPPSAPARPAAPAGKPAMGMPSARGGQSSGPVVPSSEIEEVRKQMESQVFELQRQLQEEREKLLLQTVKAKEEEAMASKVEESLKDIQDRLRREKREQELHDGLAKAETQVKELESRISSERVTWVETLKTQLGQRESQEKELESHFELRLKELERRWHEEKLNWAQTLRSKDEEVNRLKKEFDIQLEKEMTGSEKRISQVESEREGFRRELKDSAEARQQERENLTAKLDARDKEYLSVKAQQAMIVSQMRQEKEKTEQMRQLLEKMRAEKNALNTQYEGKEKDYFLMKTQFALYQTRMKTEQEIVLKELVLYKDQMHKERQNWELSIKAKEQEIASIASAMRVNEEKLKSKEQEIYSLQDKDRDSRITFVQKDERIRELEAKASGLSNSLDNALRSSDSLKSELAQSAGEIGRMRAELASSAERDRVNASMLQDLKNKLEHAQRDTADLAKKLEEKDGAVQSLKQSELEHKGEAARINEALISARREADSMRSEITVRARDTQIELSKQQEKHRAEKEELVSRLEAAERALTEKNKQLELNAAQAERILVEKNKEFDLLSSQRESVWKEKERILSEEKNRMAEMIPSLRAESASLLREKDKLMQDKLSAEEKLRSETVNVERRLFDEKEKYQELLLDKEQELGQIRSSRLTYEAEIRQQLDQRYRSDMEALRKEKDDASWKLKGEIEQLRSAMRTELMKMEQQVEEERLTWKRGQQGKENEHLELQKRFNELTQLLAAERASREQNLLKLRDEAETRVSDDQKRVGEEQEKLNAKIRALEAESAALKQHCSENEQALVLKTKELAELKARAESRAARRAAASLTPRSEEIQVPPAAEKVMLDEKTENGGFKKFWKSLNEPVIEIGHKNTGKERQN